MTGPTHRELSEADDGSVVSLAVGESVEVLLPENASTGFRWSLDRSVGPVLHMADDAPVRAERAEPGGAGARRFRFQAELAGDAAIHLKHWRPWEGDRSVTKRFVVRVQVGR